MATSRPLPARAGSYDTYGDFIRAIGDTIKQYHNSVPPVDKIMDHTAYMSMDDWAIKRRNWLAIQDALSGDL
jgi:hypothetical protein